MNKVGRSRGYGLGYVGMRLATCISETRDSETGQAKGKGKGRSMRDFLNIGPTPCDEDCEQVPYKNPDKAMRECKQYIEAIRKKLGQEPEGARLAVKGFPHDFGTYHEVVCHYDTERPESEEYAFRCEGESPSTWVEVGMVAPV